MLPNNLSFLQRLAFAIERSSKRVYDGFANGLILIANWTRKSIKYLHNSYIKLEFFVISLLYDLYLIFLALRFFAILIGIAALLLYFELWMWLLIYAAVICGAIFLYKSEDRSEEEGIGISRHHENRTSRVGILRWPFRIICIIFPAIIFLIYSNYNTGVEEPTILNHDLGQEGSVGQDAEIANDKKKLDSMNEISAPPILSNDKSIRDSSNSRLTNAESEVAPISTNSAQLMDTDIPAQSNSIIDNIHIYFENGCNRSITYVYHYPTSSGDWVTLGPLTVAPDEKSRLSKDLMLSLLNNGRITFYAAAWTNEINWFGKKDVEYNGVTYAMREFPLDVGEKLMDKIFIFNCS